MSTNSLKNALIIITGICFFFSIISAILLGFSSVHLQDGCPNSNNLNCTFVILGCDNKHNYCSFSVLMDGAKECTFSCQPNSTIMSQQCPPDNSKCDLSYLSSLEKQICGLNCFNDKFLYLQLGSSCALLIFGALTIISLVAIIILFVIKRNYFNQYRQIEKDNDKDKEQEQQDKDKENESFNADFNN